ncbi:hypothetical protein [Candidatus Palauibacter sp.]|uniref:hypothetical protein n=1 Tax=Candidatus Palauibacter sp. TaxID=3101350 RepID=UPI003C6F5DA4
MVLNHASVSAPEAEDHRVVPWLTDLVRGASSLVDANVVLPSLRMFRSIHEIPWTSGRTLYQCYESLRNEGFRDEYAFLMRLAAKLPLLNGVAEHVVDRFLGCEDVSLPAPDGEPLVLCAITDWIAVGFPSGPAWDRDRVDVRFSELLRDSSLREVSETVDHLARAAHAARILERHRIRFQGIGGPSELWRNRAVAFPDLLFGRDVGDHIQRCAAHLSTIVGKLTELDASAREWKAVGGSAPPWKTKVTRESRSTRKEKRLMEKRRFRSHMGRRETYEWHARFGDSGRIHLRFEATSREVEIGYVGPHLPI